MTDDRRLVDHPPGGARQSAAGPGGEGSQSAFAAPDRTVRLALPEPEGGGSPSRTLGFWRGLSANKMCAHNRRACSN